MRYFIDFLDGAVLSRDDEGLEFDGCADACRSAAEALVEAANDTLRARQTSPAVPDLHGLNLETQVRNEAGAVIFRACLTLALDWSDDPAGYP